MRHNSRGPSDWLVPILFRVRNVNCSTTVQTSVALTGKDVFLTYPTTSVEVSGEPAVFLLSKDTLDIYLGPCSLLLDSLHAADRHNKIKNTENPLGRFSWARTRN